MYPPLNPILERLPLKPHPRQREFLGLTCEEALFGGAAGSGKSEALLMWLAEGIEIPDYTAGIFRRYIEDLSEGNSSLMAKAYRLYPALGGTPNGLEWRFPSGAVIVLSGMAYEKSVLKHQGKEFHRVAFDELTHFLENQYMFITKTRMRKVLGFPIKLGARASANPGGPGHQWVLNRFITKAGLEYSKTSAAKTPTPPGTVFWNDERTIAYVPSVAIDNLSLDVDDYIKRMREHTNPVELARMMNGNWAVMPTGLINPKWLRYFTMQDKLYRLLVSRLDNNGNIVHTNEVAAEFHENTCRRFMTVDTAGGMKDINKEAKGKGKSWTACGVWDYRRTGTGRALILKHVWRSQAGFVEVRDNLLRLYEEWRPSSIRVEDKTMGPDLYSLMCGQIPISLIGSGNIDKVTRAAPFLNMLDQGQVYLPQGENSWRNVLEAEWLSWQGLEDDTNDQIDMASYAAIEVGSHIAGTIKVDVDPRKPMDITGGPHKPANRGWF